MGLFFSRKGPPRVRWSALVDGLVPVLQRERDEWWTGLISLLRQRQLLAGSASVSRPHDCEVALKSFQAAALYDWITKRSCFSQRKDDVDFATLLGAMVLRPDSSEAEAFFRLFRGEIDTRRGMYVAAKLLQDLGVKPLNTDDQETFGLMPMILMVATLKHVARAVGDDSGLAELQSLWDSLPEKLPTLIGPPRQEAKGPPRKSWLQLSTGLNVALQRDRDEFWDVFVSNFQKRHLQIAPSPVPRPKSCDLALRSFQHAAVMDWLALRNYFATREESYEFLDLLTAGLIGADAPATEEYWEAFHETEQSHRGLLLSADLLSYSGHKFTDLDDEAQDVFGVFPNILTSSAARHISTLFGDDEGVKLADKMADLLSKSMTVVTWDR